MPGVGNVGDFQKTFFVVVGRGLRKNKNIGLLCIKAPYFCTKKSDVFDFRNASYVFYDNRNNLDNKDKKSVSRQMIADRCRTEDEYRGVL